ncbi:MAG: response regulator transcription factor [Treponema sp.]|nr:response regulator transcription factor [Treponema sp.]
MATILIADDEKEIVSLLKFYLEPEGYTVLEAYNGKDAARIFENEKIDLFIVDIMMPQMNGYEVIKLVRSKNDGKNNIPVLVISAKTLVSDRILGLEIGADDYITKPFEPLEVVAKVKAHLRRMESIQNSKGKTEHTEKQDDESDVIKAGKLVLNKNQGTVSDGKNNFDLTKVELAVLELFMEQPKRIFTMEQIYERGWGEDLVVDDNTIRVTLSHLREKIGEAKITNIRGLGYRLECEE